MQIYTAKLGTSVSESKTLLSLGLNPNTADLWYNSYPELANRKENENSIPSWSANILLSNIIPKVIVSDNKPYYLNINYETGYISYINGDKRYKTVQFSGDLIEALVKMIESLQAENKLNLKEIDFLVVNAHAHT